MKIDNIYIELEHNKNENEIFDNYVQYIFDVSCKEMSVSVEVAYLLCSILLCNTQKNIKILDLGSGFSSYILRKKWVSSLNRIVVTVDDNGCWLEKTREFLIDMKIMTDGMVLWDNFAKDNETTYDLVFYDLGCMTTRCKELPFVLDLVKTGGLIVLDDLHKGGYRVEVEKEAKRRNLTLISTKDYTADSYGRYAGLIIYN